MKIIKSFACIMFIFVTYANAQIKVTTSGNIGINNSTPAYRLDVTGTGRFSNWTDMVIDWSGLCSSPVIYPGTNWYLQLGKSTRQVGNVYAANVNTVRMNVLSDDSIKTNQSVIADALQTIQDMDGKEYYFTTDFLNSIPDSFPNRLDFTQKQFGFMARELKQVIPELVNYDSSSGRYSVNYIGVIPILTEGIKEQQSLITSLQSSVSSHAAAILDLQTAIVDQQVINTNLLAYIGALTTSVNELHDCCSTTIDLPRPPQNEATKGGTLNKKGSESLAMLFQNNPNPFNQKTEVKYYLPAKASDVKIVIYSLNGAQIMSMNGQDNAQGMHAVSIDGTSLSAGSYYYTLLVNNREVDTKKMIIYK